MTSFSTCGERIRGGSSSLLSLKSVSENELVDGLLLNGPSVSDSEFDEELPVSLDIDVVVVELGMKKCAILLYSAHAEWDHTGLMPKP